MNSMNRITRLACAAVAIALTATTAAEPLQPQPPLSVKIATRTRAFRQGEVVLVTVTTSRDVTSVEGGAFARDIGFWRAASARQWQGLVAIPIDADTGRRDVLVRAKEAKGDPEVVRVSWQVSAAKFQERHLTVEDQYADPPQSEVERILAEAERLKQLFASTRQGRLWSGAWQMPVPGTATSSYGRQTFLNGEERGRHQGTDFRAATGTPIQAPNGGEVVLAQNLYFSGNTVVLDHGQGLYSLFAHLSKIGVKVGAKVARGDVLGEVGATGRVTGPHLHWAVRLHDGSVDPLSLVHAVASIDPGAAAPSGKK